MVICASLAAGDDVVYFCGCAVAVFAGYLACVVVSLEDGGAGVVAPVAAAVHGCGFVFGVAYQGNSHEVAAHLAVSDPHRLQWHRSPSECL